VGGGGRDAKFRNGVTRARCSLRVNTATLVKTVIFKCSSEENQIVNYCIFYEAELFGYPLECHALAVPLLNTVIFNYSCMARNNRTLQESLPMHGNKALIAFEVTPIEPSHCADLTHLEKSFDGNVGRVCTVGHFSLHSENVLAPP
jgi:hypothetical protein